MDLPELFPPDHSATKRLTLLVWGASGCGKTTLAATAPGRKLWLNFDPDGPSSITQYSDSVRVWDLADAAPNIAAGFKGTSSTTIKTLDKLLAANEFDTLVFDSLTTFGELALAHGVTEAAKTSKGRDSTLEEPGYAGFGRKHTWVLQCVRTLLKLTLSHRMHCIFTGHEGTPERDKQGAVIEIPLMLGGSLRGTAPINLSEVWIFTDTNGKRELSVRNKGLRKGGKTRMFKTTSKQVSFAWNYDADRQHGEGIADWYDSWKANNFRKIDLPS